MKALKFTLSGENAFFKKPEVNSYYYFTYSQIHKVALLGIFGAILGYDGYAQMKTNTGKKQELEEGFPEFYEKLQQLKLSIVPKNPKGYIPKKIQIFNNSVGYASGHGNLIVKEQWLENPKWEIYVLLDCEEAEKLAESLLERRCVYVPYLGKNDHFADISDVQVVELNTLSGEQQISSLFPKTLAVIGEFDEEDEIPVYKYEERLPVGLNGYTNQYEYDTFCYTNLPVRFDDTIVYKADEEKMIFY